MPRRVCVSPRRPAAAAAPPSGDLQDDDALEAEAPLELLQRIDADAEPDLLRATRLDDLRDDAAIVPTGTAKPMPADAPRLAEDHRVHADELPGRVEQRPAGVARD